MKPLDTYRDTASRARPFLEYHDGLMNTRARRIRSDWKGKFQALMHWPANSPIERVDSSDAVIVLRPGATLTPDHFTQDWLDDQLRAALTFGVSALWEWGQVQTMSWAVSAVSCRFRQESL
jgi:hypothetical protein